MFLQLSGVLLLETHNIFPGKWARFSKSRVPAGIIEHLRFEVRLARKCYLGKTAYVQGDSPKIPK